MKEALLKLAYWLSQAITYGLAACMILGCLFGCAQQPIAPITLPPVCPAHREAPAMPDIAPTLPNLPADLPDPAGAILANRIASQQAYAECVSRYNSLRDWANAR
jgi:hypothetical protein